MPSNKKTCRVCGKVYEGCYRPAKTNAFNWRDVACSVECGQKYLAEVLASRNKTPISYQKEEVIQPLITDEEFLEDITEDVDDIEEDIEDVEDVDDIYEADFVEDVY